MNVSERLGSEKGGSWKKTILTLQLRLFWSSAPCSATNDNEHTVIRFVEYEERKCMQFGILSLLMLEQCRLLLFACIINSNTVNNTAPSPYSEGWQ